MRRLFFKRLLTVPCIVILLLLTFLISASPAFANTASISVNPNHAAVGTSVPVTLKGSGWAPRETVVFTFDQTSFNPPLGLQADQNGKFKVKGTFTLPATLKPGKHSIEATGLTSHLTAKTSFKLTSKSEKDDDDDDDD
jgi:hypothetical protein